MSFGKNLQFLRRLSNDMTQEELAEKLQVSRQTVSKWELDAAYPEMGKLLELCRLFSCGMDELVRGDMGVVDAIYSDIRTETLDPMRYVSYAVISPDPETDALARVKEWGRQRYAAITIRDPFTAPFRTIPNGYKTLMAYMQVNGLEHKEWKDLIACFEKEYVREGTTYMDVYIAIK